MVLRFFTVKDGIVQRSLAALSRDGSCDRMTRPIVVGGMATQLHTGELADCLRPTSDLDLMFVPGIDSYVSFVDGIGGEVAGTLKRSGYQVQLKKAKRRPQYEVKVMDGQGNRARELFFIHFDLTSPGIRSRTEAVTLREAENSLEMEYAGVGLLVKRMEDILSHKLRRAGRHLEYGSPLERSVFTNADAGNWSEIASIPLEPWLEYLIETQNAADPSVKDLGGGYMLNKDLFDICLLARKIEGVPGSFNRAYYSAARAEIDAL